MGLPPLFDNAGGSAVFSLPVYVNEAVFAADIPQHDAARTDGRLLIVSELLYDILIPSG